MGLIMAFLFSCAVGITKYAQGVYFTIPYFVCMLSVSEFATGLVIAWATGTFPIFGERKSIPWLILVGLIYGGFVTLIYVPLAFIPAVDDIALLYANPILATILGAVIFKDRFGIFSGIGLTLYSLGILLLSQPEFLFGASDIVWTDKRKLGYVLAAVSALLTAVTLIILRGLKDRVPSATLPLWAFMAQFMYCFPFLFFFPAAPNHGPIKWLAILPVALGGVFAAIAEFFLCRTCCLLPAGHVGVIGSTQLIWAAFWGWLIAGEAVGWFTAAGCALMMLGVASVGYNTNRWGHEANIGRCRAKFQR